MVFSGFETAAYIAFFSLLSLVVGVCYEALFQPLGRWMDRKAERLEGHGSEVENN